MDSEQPFDYSESYAVLIGTSEYQDKRFPALPSADNSLEGMRQILTDPGLCGWPPARVRQLANASDNRQVLIKLREWARNATGVFLLYYVGHGTPGEQGPCLTLTDTQEQHSDATGLEYRNVRKALLDSPARVKIVILDCCYAGRAIPPVQSGQTLFTDISGTFVLAASDLAAHVPEHQELACTSFTGELLDLIRKGIPDGPEELTLEDIYRHLRTRLSEVDLPDPNSGGTGTAGAFRLARNAALRPGPPIPRFPREPEPSVPWWMRSRRRWGGLAAAALLVAGAVAYGSVTWHHGPGPQCGATAGTSARSGGDVVIESDLDADPENQLIAYIYRDALQGNGVPVDTNVTPSLRVAYYGQVCSGAVTLVPEYNGALLTTSVDQSSGAVSTGAVDDALGQDLPSSLEILAPAAAQDKDSVTVTAATAAKYHLKTIADLRQVADKLTLGAPEEFYGREQGTTGLNSTYGVVFGNFTPLDYDDDSGAGVSALLDGAVGAADVYTTVPEIAADHLVVLGDPKGLFRAENVVPLVYKPAVQADPQIATILNYVSLRLTQSQLIELNVKAAQPGASIPAIAAQWSQTNIGTS
jgi:glycine betaine/choline ABC-type transport system substrate-binding protein